MEKYVKSFDDFFESFDSWEQDLILYVTVKLYPKEVYNFNKTEQRELVSKVDSITKRIAQFINKFNRRDNKTNIENLWSKFKMDKPILAHITGEDIRQYVYWDKITKKLLFKPDKVERFLEYYFNVEHHLKSQEVLQEKKKK